MTRPLVYDVQCGTPTRAHHPSRVEWKVLEMLGLGMLAVSLCGTHRRLTGDLESLEPAIPTSVISVEEGSGIKAVTWTWERVKRAVADGSIVTSLPSDQRACFAKGENVRTKAA